MKTPTAAPVTAATTSDGASERLDRARAHARERRTRSEASVTLHRVYRHAGGEVAGSTAACDALLRSASCAYLSSAARAHRLRAQRGAHQRRRRRWQESAAALRSPLPSSSHTKVAVGAEAPGLAGGADQHHWHDTVTWVVH